MFVFSSLGGQGEPFFVLLQIVFRIKIRFVGEGERWHGQHAGMEDEIWLADYGLIPRGSRRHSESVITARYHTLKQNRSHMFWEHGPGILSRTREGDGQLVAGLLLGRASSSASLRDASSSTMARLSVVATLT
jgi:hypothetical protein